MASRLTSYSSVNHRAKHHTSPRNPLRSILPTLSWLVLLVALTAGFMASRKGVLTNTVTLPIEVISAESDTVSVTVDVANASNINRLWMQAHRPGYKYGDGDAASQGLQYGGSPKASVRINGGPWIDIDNQVATCAYPESEYECIGGAFATVRFTVPISGVVTGTNTIDFRFNGTEGLSIGWRVLYFNFLRSSYGGPLTVPAVASAGAITSSFVYDDFDAWQPPLPGQQNIDAGKVLWETASLVDSEGGAFLAVCSDCHAKNGRDLKFFNYSNHSIIERSKFHGLSQTEGEQIASYIRSLAYPNHGTPWDPPYQPGPTIRGTSQHPDVLPSEYWAAGAGLEWVLDDDEDVLPYLFPNGIHASRVSTDSTLNLREIPIAIQLPDWNEWLPRVHPKDAWGSTFTTDRAYTEYSTDIPNALAAGVQAAISNGSIKKELDDFGEYFRRFREEGVGNETFFGGWGSDGTVADYKLGLHQWRVVKLWEIMTTNTGLEEAAPQIFQYGEARSWISGERTVFDVAAHISSAPQFSDYPHGSPLQNYYSSTAWYELQTIINASNRTGGSVRPMDWRYHYGHMQEVFKRSGIREPLRYLKAFYKVNQQQDQGDDLTTGGYWMHFVGIGRLFALGGYNSSKDPFLDMDQALRAQLMEAGLRAQLVKLLRHAPSEWPRGMHQCCMDPETYQPTPYPGSGLLFDEKTYSEHYYRGIPLALDLGVAPGVLDSLADWGASMWPLGDWDSLVPNQNQNQAPSVGVTSPSDGAAFTAPASVTIDVQASDSDGTVSQVEFFADGTLLGQDTSAPYSYTWTNVAAGSYTLTARATDNEGATTTSASVSISVSSNNAAPQVSLTAPANGASFTEGDDVVITATASDSDGTVSQVEFFADGTLLGQDTSVPSSYTWTNVAAGNYTLTAQATDNEGATTTSDPITITVSSPGSGNGRVTAGLQVLYTFAETNGTTVHDVSGVGAPLDLSISNPAAVTWLGGNGLSVDASTVIASAGAASKIINAAQATNEITIEAWLQTADLNQSGPARMVTLSQGTGERNFTLGQNNSAFDVRFRTTETSMQGKPSVGTPAGNVVLSLQHVLYTRDASGTARIYVAGVEQVSATVGGDLSNWNAGYSFGLANETTGNRSWLGILRLAAVYSRALSQAEVQQNFNAGPSPGSGSGGTLLYDIGLQQGWNLTSSGVVPDQADLDSIFADVLDDIVLVKNGAGQTFIPEFGLNLIGDWDPQQAYQIYASTNTTLTIEGTAIVPEGMPIPLPAQWNLVPYLRDAPIAADIALASIASVLVIAKDHAGRVYIPEFGINTIGDMEPGQGYKVYVDQAVTLTYPANSASPAAKARLSQGSASPMTGPSATGLAASAVLVVEASTLPDGAEITVRGPERRLVGRGIVQQGRAVITVRGDETLTQGIVEGAQAEEALVLEMKMPQAVAEQQLTVTSVQDALSGQHLSGALRYEDDAFLIVQVTELPRTFSLSQNYPNPFNPSTTIEYGLPADGYVRLEVFNAVGQRVAALVDGEMKAGVHRIVFDASHLASGFYFYRLIAAEFVEARKMMLVR